MEKQLTAVEWLAKELETYGDPQFCELEWEQLDSLIEQAKEIEKEQKYSIDFIMWYSGMDKDKIENAHKRWIRETFKSE
jgi:hypothetical protein